MKTCENQLYHAKLLETEANVDLGCDAIRWFHTVVVHRSAKCANGEVILGQEPKGWAGTATHASLHSQGLDEHIWTWYLPKSVLYDPLAHDVRVTQPIDDLVTYFLLKNFLGQLIWCTGGTDASGESSSLLNQSVGRAQCIWVRKTVGTVIYWGCCNCLIFPFGSCVESTSW